MSFVAGWLRVALRDLRGGIGKFRVLLACIALGVGAIAAVGSVGAALHQAVDRDARTFLGGDIEAQLATRAASAEERAFLETLGRVTAVTEANARATIGEDGAFIGLRAVEALYPLVGAVEIRPAELAGTPLAQLLATDGDVHGAVVDQLLLERLAIGIGGRFRIGEAEFEARAVLGALPDQAARGFQLGLPVLISAEAMAATGILQPGALIRYRYQIVLDRLSYDEAAKALRERFPDAGWETRSPEEAARTISRFFDVFTRFLTLVGLSSLLVGGVGVSNAAAAYISERQSAIATMRSLGATAARILVHFLAQILVLGAAGTLIGVVLGATATLLVLPILGGYLSLALEPSLHWGALLAAAGFGLLIAAVFAFLPLRRAQRLRPASLFRAAGGGEGRLGWRDVVRPRTALPLALGVAAIAGLAVLVTAEPLIVLWYALGAIAGFLLLRLAAFLLQVMLRLVPPLPLFPARLAVRSIHAPGAPTPTVVLSLGIGLTLLLLIALIDSNVRGQLQGELAAEAPSFVLLDLLDDEVEALESFAETEAGVASFKTTAMLRGIVTSVRGLAAKDLGELSEDIAPVFQGDTALTWSRSLPGGSQLVEGTWWPEDYTGPPLVSLTTDLREELGLKVGDSIEIAVTGRPIPATIANFREIDEDSLEPGFRIVFSPGLIEGAPATFIGRLKADPGAEDAVGRALVRQFPELSFVPVGEALARVSGVLATLANAVSVVGGIALVSGVFVLAGALAAGRKQRQADAVLMKVLGATRGEVITAYLLEYGLLGALSALIAAGLGTLGAWVVIERLFELPFAFEPGLVVLVVAFSTLITILAGLATTWSALSVRPARHLRDAQ